MRLRFEWGNNTRDLKQNSQQDVVAFIPPASATI